jgi:hypothetical protein
VKYFQGDISAQSLEFHVEEVQLNIIHNCMCWSHMFGDKASSVYHRIQCYWLCSIGSWAVHPMKLANSWRMHCYGTVCNSNAKNSKASQIESVHICNILELTTHAHTHCAYFM